MDGHLSQAVQFVFERGSTVSIRRCRDGGYFSTHTLIIERRTKRPREPSSRGRSFVFVSSVYCGFVWPASEPVPLPGVAVLVLFLLFLWCLCLADVLLIELSVLVLEVFCANAPEHSRNAPMTAIENVFLMRDAPAVIVA